MSNTLNHTQAAVFRKALEPFVIFSDEEFNVFAGHLYTKNFKKRECFIECAKVCSEVGFIVSGSFRFYFIREGVEVSNYFCFEGELISSYMSFLRRTPGFTTIEAMEGAEVICFSYSSMQDLLQDPRTAYKMERFGRMVAEDLICCYEERLISFVAQSPEERYCDLLEKQPDLFQRIPQHYIANFLGITPVSLSRIRKRIAATDRKK